jgi:flagellar biosynthesis/type III secretory pathway chaperone
LYPQAKTERDQELNRRVEMVIKDCDDLFTINQKNAIMPKEIGTTIRLHDIDH